MDPVRVRYAPSPTGRHHIGGARTALYNYLLAQQTGGQFILRLEDTDQKRFQAGSEEEIMNGLRWLGVQWDEGPDIGGPHAPYRQTPKKDRYLAYAQQLIDSGHAYPCFCTPERIQEVRQEQQRNKQQPRYDGHCRHLNQREGAARRDAGERHVIRFKTPRDGTITAHDHLRGDITIENRHLDDFILVKSDGLAVYHLAAMADDHEMGITHVLRSEEWLATFPLHVHIYEALGWKQPEWVHLSVFLKPSGKGKMSKREGAEMAKGGKSIFLADLEALGYIPEAVVNWLSLMGWSYDDHTEFFSMASLIEKFSLEKLNPSPAAINFSKFDHFNGLHIRNLTVDDLAIRIKPFFERAGIATDDETLLAITPLLQERLKTLDDAVPLAAFFFADQVQAPVELLIPRKTSPAEALMIAQESAAILEQLPVFTHDSLDTPLRALAERLDLKAGQVFGVLRGAVTGQQISPPLLETMEILGKDIVVERVRQARATLAEAS
jgi:glutamyl-tRNA synthetase